MSPEIRYAMDGGTRKFKNRERPYLIDKETIIPQEYFDVVLYENEGSRSHTVYLDPAYEVEYIDTSYEQGPRIRVNTMYESDFIIRSHHAYGETAHQRSCTVAQEKVGNNKSARYYEEYLREMHNDKGIRLVHIVAVKEEGYPSFLLFGYITPNVSEYYK